MGTNCQVFYTGVIREDNCSDDLNYFYYSVTNQISNKYLIHITAKKFKPTHSNANKLKIYFACLPTNTCALNKDFSDFFKISIIRPALLKYTNFKCCGKPLNNKRAKSLIQTADLI